MRFSVRVLCGVFVAVMSGSAFAQDEEEEGLSGQVAFGYLATSGNTENETLNLNFGGQYIRDRWTHALDGLAVKARTNQITTAEAYGLAWQSRYELSERSYVFGLIDWDKDEFSAIAKQTREVIGYGRRLIDRDNHLLNGEAGLGARQADFRDGTNEDEGIMRLALDYQWTISETARFNQTVSIESGDQNTYTETMSSLSADVWGNFAVVFSYTIKRNSTVPVGTVRRDTFTAISLEYSF